VIQFESPEEMEAHFGVCLTASTPENIIFTAPFYDGAVIYIAQIIILRRILHIIITSIL